MGLHLVYFTRPEFNRGGVDWFPRMSTRLLVALDLARYQLGTGIFISPADEAVGRRNGPEDKSQHNYDYYGEVRAVDFFVPGADPIDVIATLRMMGFTGIGLYPQGLWKGERACRYHADMRQDHLPGRPAEWGRINNGYTTVQRALAYAKEKVS